MIMTQKIIFSMSRVSKTYPGKKTVIKDVSLSFFYGAKIGVLGLNGAGKSTVLRIIAGVDKEYDGDVNLSKGVSVGYLEQEPLLDPEKTVKDIVEEGAAEHVAIRDAYEAINDKFADPEADMDALLEEQGKLQDKMDAYNIWDLDSRLDLAMDALRCPPADQKC
jgi:ATPase subunit of ABC transporter with duplicated ATPase domains